MPTRERLLELRAEHFADDLDAPDEMMSWTEAACAEYFQTGGEVVPTWRPPEQPPSKPVRFLCLHGGGGNAKLMQMQLGRVVRALGGSAAVELNYLEGSRKWAEDEVDPGLRRLFPGLDFYGWYGVTNDAGVKGGTAAYVAAQCDPRVEFVYHEHERALDRVEAHIEQHGPFDVLCGFSQGSIMATMLTDRLLGRARRGEGRGPGWRLNVFFAGMPPRGKGCISVFDPPQPALDFPTVSCIGRADQFYEWGNRLAELYAGRSIRLISHAGGHETPKDPDVNSEIAGAIWEMLGLA